MKTKLIVAILAATGIFNLAACQHDSSHSQDLVTNKVAENTEQQEATIAMQSIGTLASNDIVGAMNSDAPGVKPTATASGINDYNTSGTGSPPNSQEPQDAQQQDLTTAMPAPITTDTGTANPVINSDSSAPVNIAAANESAPSSDLNNGPAVQANGDLAATAQMAVPPVTNNAVGQNGAPSPSNIAAPNTPKGVSNAAFGTGATK